MTLAAPGHRSRGVGRAFDRSAGSRVERRSTGCRDGARIACVTGAAGGDILARGEGRAGHSLAGAVVERCTFRGCDFAGEASIASAALDDVASTGLRWAVHVLAFAGKVGRARRSGDAPTVPCFAGASIWN